MERRDFGNRGGFQRSFAPVKVGEEMDVKIEAVGEKGDGIAKKNGFVLFVPGVKEGDQVRIRVNKVFRKVGFADVIGESSGVPQDENAEAAPEEGQEAAPEEPQPEDSEEF